MAIFRMFSIIRRGNKLLVEHDLNMMCCRNKMTKNEQRLSVNEAIRE